MGLALLLALAGGAMAHLNGQAMPKLWKPVVYAHRATGSGAASLRANASELVRTGFPRRVVIRMVLRFVARADRWERPPIPLPISVGVPVPPARQVYSQDTDQILLAIPDPVGLFWAEWEEDNHRVTSLVYAGPTLCNDVMLGPAPAGRVAACIPFADHAEARFVPDPARR